MVLFTDEKVLPEFPLIPASRGFCITLRKTLATFKAVLIKKSIIQRSDDWQDNENTTELINNITNQCQEMSESVDGKAAECDESSSNSNSSSNTQENSKKPTLNGNQFKEAMLPSATNSSAAAPSETKNNTSSQNTS